MAPTILATQISTVLRWKLWSTIAFGLLLILYHVPHTAAFPPSGNAGDHIASLVARGEIADGNMLRVLPIGDSITFGAQSTDSNGYRRHLYDALDALGNPLHFVGGLYTGTGSDWDMHHEGHRGYVIDQIRVASSTGIYSGPNIIALHAGTNDMNRDVDVSTAPDRIKTLMDEIHKQNPHAVFLLCQIIPSPTPATLANIKVFNQALAEKAPQWQAEGMNIILVPMFDKLTLSDLKDDLHPNDGGYQKMADAFYAAVLQANNNGWIQTPDPPAKHIPAECRDDPAWHDYGLVADGATIATSDGPFIPGFVQKGKIADGACPGDRVHLPDLNGDGLADYVCVGQQNGMVVADIRLASGGWQQMGTIATGADGRAGEFILFADLNGDKMDDYIWQNPKTGDVYGWINRGPAKDGTWTWQDLGKIGNTGTTAAKGNLSMADINGDGRADFLVTDRSTGSVTAWLNTGAEVMPDYYKIGEIADGSSWTKDDAVWIADFTGEGRADYMLIGQTGKVTGFVNRRLEKSLVPQWSQAYTVAEGPDGAKQSQVRLADMNGDGKVDYLLVDEKTGALTLWENTGTGGEYQPGDGVFLCDLDGDGIADYFWISPSGKGYGYLNTGHGTNNWEDIGEIATGDHPRQLVRMGRMTTTGRADYIVLDKDSGAAQWYENTGRDGKWQFDARGVLATGPRSIIENSYQWQFRVENVRFADLDGDGIDDYIYVHEQGYIVMWQNLNTQPVSWGLPHMVAKPKQHVLSSVVHLADIDGDGQADYVVIGQETGSSQAWINMGFASGNITWGEPFHFADGTGPGDCIILAEMTGDRRADWVSVNPNSAALSLWENGCWEVSSGDGGGGSSGDDGDDWGAYDFCEGVRDESFNLTDIQSDRSAYPDHCIALYTLQALLNQADNVTKTYNDVNNGYDEEFTYYVEYVKNAVGSTLMYNFMFNDSLTSVNTAGEDTSFPGDGPGLNYFNCSNSLRGPSPCRSFPQSPGDTETQYHLLDSQGFKAATSKLGMLNDWVTFGDTQLDYEGVSPVGSQFHYTAKFTGDFPKTNESMVVPNAKNYASAAIPKLQKLRGDMQVNQLYMLAGLWIGGDARDASAAFGPAVFMAEQSVDDMSQAKAIGVQEDDDERKEAREKKKGFILLILGAALAVVPFVGETLADFFGLATLASMIDIFGEIDNLTYDLYIAVSDKGGAPILFFNIVLGASEVAIHAGEFIAKELGRAVTEELEPLEKSLKVVSHLSESAALLADIVVYISCKNT